MYINQMLSFQCGSVVEAPLFPLFLVIQDTDYSNKGRLFLLFC